MLQAEHETLLSLLYMCPVGLVEVNATGAITLINPHAMSLLMPIATNAVVDNLFDILRPYTASELTDEILDFAGTYGTVFEKRRFHLPSGRRDPAPYVLSCTLLMIKRDCLMMLLQDVSRDVAQEAISEAVRRQIAASERLVALGTMAGGLAHEINNPIAIIHALANDLAETAERKKLDTAAVTAAAAQIVDLCKRIEKINSDLLRLARDGARDPVAPAAIADIIDSAVRACEPFFRDSGVELAVGHHDPELTVACREVQIGQILVNLLHNGLYAARTHGGAPRVRIEGRRRGNDVEVRVWDTGEGVPHELRDHIMEPFFTTKPVGEGTGLGLSISAQIATAHGGRIEIDDREAETCFVLTLPALKDSAYR